MTHTERELLLSLAACAPLSYKSPVMGKTITELVYMIRHEVEAAARENAK